VLSFDLSYDELLTYQGTNPRPADFDAFWDKALLSLDEVAADAEFVDAADFPLTTATAQHLYFTGTGGYRVHAKVLRPAEPTGPAVLLFHGYGGEQPKWVELLPYAARGFTVAALDVREQVGFRTPSQEANAFSLQHHLPHPRCRTNRRTRARHALAAADAWLSLRSSSAGASPALHRRRHR